MVRLEELSGPELRRLIDGGLEVAVVPFGSVEYQGAHLPLGCDALVADAVGRQVAERLDAVLAPTVRVGHAESHVQGTGTLSLPAETLREVALHLAESLLTHGLRVIALVSAHGGNQAGLEEAAQSLNSRRADAIVCAPRGDVGPDPGSHSGRWLTSVMLLLHPDLVDLAAAEANMRNELEGAAAARGAQDLERFVSSIVQRIGDAVRTGRPSAP